jgi:asparagine synthase (glutamine-hydrolysing)
VNESIRFIPGLAFEMCGIAGFTGLPSRSLLERMTESLRHRGPDSAGHWEGNGISLGMRRLAIIDVETGQQPVFNEDGTVAVVFNGEIYNHLELRASLVRAGHRFSSDHSDTEVIVHLYEEFGLDFVQHLNGMFAIALWDCTQRKLILVRDRLGIKPLYFAFAAGNLIFGSEPKALLIHPDVSRSPNFASIHHYLSLKNVPAPGSAFRDIEQLRGGELAVFDGRDIKRQRWWQANFGKCSDLGEADAAGRILELLHDSVRLQMRSDVPFGAYLSGGVDSSTIVALLAKIGGRKLKTFTLVYNDDFLNKESDRIFARKMSDRVGSEHHEHLVTFDDLPDKLDHVVSAFDEPFSGVISTYFLTQSIAEHVKVALSGDGADEMFGSYLAHRIAQPLSDYVAGRIELAAQSTTHADFARLAGLAGRGDEAAQRMGLYLLDDQQKRALYSPMMSEAVGKASTEDMIRAILRDCPSSDPLNRSLFLDQQTLLSDQVLPFVDRLSMAHSVEVRPPFLDHRLAEFAGTLPGSMKISAGRVKHILKEAVKDLLPADLLARPKEGFIMPVNEWLLGKLRSYVQARLAPERLVRHGLFRGSAVQTLLDEHYSGMANRGNQIWNLLMLQLWWERCV